MVGHGAWVASGVRGGLVPRDGAGQSAGGDLPWGGRPADTGAQELDSGGDPNDASDTGAEKASDRVKARIRVENQNEFPYRIWMGQRSVFVRKRDSAEDEFAYERGKSYRIRATFPPQNVIFLPMDENYRLEVTNRFEPSWVPPGLEDGGRGQLLNVDR